ncbi:AmmeMemoRadiSam system protein B [Candidatus Poribacteria bacterium]|nr:AmmeMemoRadiSam system protein B [Candidatus Poribacteria bacterium]
MPRKQYAANFYAGASASRIEKFLKGYTPARFDSPLVAGLVPHAGWDFSGAVAAKVFKSIECSRKPETIVLFGTVHHDIRCNAIYPSGSWHTPLGEVQIDESLVGGILSRTEGLLEADESAHFHEHSIEVQMPFLKHFFPCAKAAPIAVLPDENAPVLGRKVGEFLKESGANAFVVGTTDLTHYGDAYYFAPRGSGPAALEWIRQNDARIIELAVKMKAEEILPEATRKKNACGPGAMAATVAAARALGSTTGRVIEYTTSYDVMPEPVFRMGVGYVGMVFCGTQRSG